MFGLRGSLDLAMTAPALLFDDETSFGLAHALAASGAGDVAYLFELTSVADAETTLTTLGIANAALVERQLGDTHHDLVESTLLQLIEARARKQFVLTGKSLSIQWLSRALKGKGLTSGDIKAKAYWDLGKTGLD